MASNPQLKLRAIFIRRPATADRTNAGLIDLIPLGFSTHLNPCFIRVHPWLKILRARIASNQT
jgi:hypothetical protein